MLHVDDIVTFSFGPRTMRARVVEDRGQLGVGGRQIVVVEVEQQVPATDVRRFEMPAAELTVVQQAAA
jgi:hypothetical protein